MQGIEALAFLLRELSSSPGNTELAAVTAADSTPLNLHSPDDVSTAPTKKVLDKLWMRLSRIATPDSMLDSVKKQAGNF